jgi:hypothetical protein
VARAEHLLPDEVCPSEELLGFGVPALVRVEAGQIVHDAGRDRVLGHPRLFPDVKRPEVELLGLGWFRQILVEQRQVGQGDCKLRVFVSQRVFPDSSGAHEQGFGVRDPAEVPVVVCEVCQRERNVGVRGPERLLQDIDRPAPRLLG